MRAYDAHEEHEKGKRRHKQAFLKAYAQQRERTLLGVDAVEHGRVLQHVWQNHEANVAAPQVTAELGVKMMKDGSVTLRGRDNEEGDNAHLLQTRDFAVLARENDAAQLTAHVVLGFHQPPTIHLTISKLNCTQIHERRKEDTKQLKRRALDSEGDGHCLPVTMCPSASCNSLIGKPMLPIESQAIPQVGQ